MLGTRGVLRGISSANPLPAASAANRHNQQQEHNTTIEKKIKTIHLQKEKNTKNTVKFAEIQTQGEAPIVGTLYVQKCYAASRLMPHGLPPARFRRDEPLPDAA